MDVDHGQLVYPSLKDCPVVMDLHELVNSGGWQLWDVPFATNANDSYVVNVVQLSNDTLHDTVYTANPSQIAAFEQAGYVNDGSVFTAYDQPLTGLDPVWLMQSPSGQHAVTSSPIEYATWRGQGWSEDGVAFYTVRFPNAVPEPSTGVMAGVGIAYAGWGTRRRKRA